MAAKIELEIFNGKTDFLLWRKKMKIVLIQQKVGKALDELYPTAWTEDKKKEDEIAFSTIILHLSDNILRKVDEVKSTAELWKKLEQLYLVKSLPNKIFLLEQFFGFKMDTTKDLDANIDDFNKLCLDLSNCDQKFSDEHFAVILLNSLPDSYREIKNAIKYGRESLTYEVVVNALKSRDLELKSETKDRGEGLTVRGRTPNRNGNQNHNWNKNRSKSKSRSKSVIRGRKCYYCHKEGHYIKDCFKKQREEKAKTQTDGDLAIVSNDSDNGEVLAVSLNNDNVDWILDSGCTYHMCPTKSWFHSYNKIDGGKVLLGNNMSCNVVGIGSVQVKLDDGTVKTLSSVKHVLEL